MKKSDKNYKLINLTRAAGPPARTAAIAMSLHFKSESEIGNANINTIITQAFLVVQDCNVIVVDSKSIANQLYSVSIAGVPNVGEFLANFLVWLFNTAGGNWTNVHLVGFGLGAHVVGNTGCTINGHPSRVTV